MDTNERNRLAQEYSPLVKRIAYHLMARLPASVEVDDLIQAGLIGLLDAVSNYDGSQGAQFESYATQRVRGAMLDQLREADWLPRKARKHARDIEAATAKTEQKLGRAANEREIAEVMGVPLADYQGMLQEARGCQLFYYEDFQGEEEGDFFDHYRTSEQAGPLDVLADRRFRQNLVDEIGNLPEREKLVMSLYYEQEMNLKEIGLVLGVTESRVCQLHSQAVARLRAKLRNWTAS